MTESARSATELDHPTTAGATVTEDNTAAKHDEWAESLSDRTRSLGLEASAALLRMAEAIERNCLCDHCGSAADRLRREAKRNG